MKAPQIGGSVEEGYDLQGSLTYDTVPQLFRDGELSFRDAASLDLAAVDRLDSAGLALLVEWSCAAKKRGQRLVLKNVPASVRSVIDVSGLKHILSVSED